MVFNYDKLTWTTGTASSGSSSGLGGTPAQVYQLLLHQPVKNLPSTSSSTKDVYDLRIRSLEGIFMKSTIANFNTHAQRLYVLLLIAYAVSVHLLIVQEVFERRALFKIKKKKKKKKSVV